MYSMGLNRTSIYFEFIFGHLSAKVRSGPEWGAAFPSRAITPGARVLFFIPLPPAG
jgi:hypothetical protein